MLHKSCVRRSLGRVLLAPLIEKKQGRGWKLIGWDDEQGISLTIESEKSLLLIELEPRDESRPCYERTQNFNVCIRHPFVHHHALDDQEHRLVRRILNLIRIRERALPSFDRPVTSQSTLVREIEIQHLLVPEGARHYYVNPYVGCVIGCEFCYVIARSDMSRRLEGLPHIPWGRYVDVKLNAAQVLREEVKIHPPGAVRMSPILTDPYQPIERRYRITRQCLEVLLEAHFFPAILTRARRVVEDIDLLKRFSKAAVGFSIPSNNDEMRRIFEPGADPVQDRWEALNLLHEAGIRTFAVIQPALPMNPQRLVDALAPCVDAVRIDRMVDAPAVRHLYEQAGVPEAMNREFYDDLRAELVGLFAERGIPIDEMDDMSGLLGLPEGKVAQPLSSVEKTSR